jgi:hypothetical protein
MTLEWLPFIDLRSICIYVINLDVNIIVFTITFFFIFILFLWLLIGKVIMMHVSHRCVGFKLTLALVGVIATKEVILREIQPGVVIHYRGHLMWVFMGRLNLLNLTPRHNFRTTLIVITICSCSKYAFVLLYGWSSIGAMAAKYRLIIHWGVGTLMRHLLILCIKLLIDKYLYFFLSEPWLQVLTAISLFRL